MEVPAEVQQVLFYSIYGNPAWRWCLAIAVLLLSLLVLRFILARATKKLKDLGQKRSLPILEFISTILGNTKSFVLLIVAVWAALSTLVPPPALMAMVNTIAVVLLFLQGALWGDSIISYIILRKIEETRQETPEETSALGAVGFLLRLGLWTLVSLLLLDNLGVDVTTLVAGLGIGSVAIALAVQNILGDMFCSISILLDKPFNVGDFIIIGDKMGVVERIGVKSTRIKSLQGEQIVVSNADLTSSRIQNFKRMYERRVPFTIGVTYETPKEKLEQIPVWIRSIIEATPNSRFDRAHFAKFGAYSLDFETVYYVLSSDYNIFMDTQQSINLAIVGKFQEEGVEFAYPTQMIYHTASQADGREAAVGFP